MSGTWANGYGSSGLKKYVRSAQRLGLWHTRLKVVWAASPESYPAAVYLQGPTVESRDYPVRNTSPDGMTNLLMLAAAAVLGGLPVNIELDDRGYIASAAFAADPGLALPPAQNPESVRVMRGAATGSRILRSGYSTRRMPSSTVVSWGSAIGRSR
jgi:hypothetical protein